MQAQIRNHHIKGSVFKRDTIQHIKTVCLANFGKVLPYVFYRNLRQITWDHSFPFRDKIQGIISAAASEVKYGLIRIHDNVIKSLKPVICLYDTPVVGLTPVTVLPVFL